MAADDQFSKPIVLNDLLQFKALDPLPVAAFDELAKIAALDVTTFYEQEVRTYVIDPIVRILGYDKGREFSADLGRPIEFIAKNKFPDYQLNLWKENFWLIEAKRPRVGENAFGYEDLRQAVEYAIHPNINAALVVLCDGIKLEVFDREVSLTEPVLRVSITNLRDEFDKVRRLLEPMQVWFFQKRRVVRLIDKVFDKEFNLQRIEEFKSLIDRRLTSKNAVVLENYRRNIKSDYAGEIAKIPALPTEDLVNAYMFFENTRPFTNALIRSLVERCEHNTFRVLYMVFPDLPRDSNDAFMGQAVMFLAALGEKHPSVNWLPAWLVQGAQAKGSIEAATQYLLSQCLSTFADDEPRRIIQLAASSMKRVFKLLMMIDEKQWRQGEVMHFLSRYHVPELTWDQIVSSPERHLIDRMNVLALTATSRFVSSCQPKRGMFTSEVAKIRLKEMWALEKAILASVPDYGKLRKERDLGEMQMIEWVNVSYDNLGHLTLCLLPPKWIEYVLNTHPTRIAELASMQSWKAKEILGMGKMDEVELPANQWLADRFFFGDIAMLEALKAGYSGK